MVFSECHRSGPAAGSRQGSGLGFFLRHAAGLDHLYPDRHRSGRHAECHRPRHRDDPTAATGRTATAGRTDGETLFNQNIKDAYFDYDKANIRPDAETALTGDAAFLKDHASIKFTIEGKCDDRGSEEYNLGLGDKRATAAKNFLVNAGVSADRISTISYGKSRPVAGCDQSAKSEDCWQQNRVDHFHYGAESNKQFGY